MDRVTAETEADAEDAGAVEVVLETGATMILQGRPLAQRLVGETLLVMVQGLVLDEIMTAEGDGVTMAIPPPLGQRLEPRA